MKTETKKKVKEFFVTSISIALIAVMGFASGRITANPKQSSMQLPDQPSIQSSVPADENSTQINLHFADDYIYECWGRIQQVEPLTGCDYSVMAVQHVKQGGEYYEEYGWRTYFVPNEVLDEMGEISYGDEAKIWKITAKNCDEGGGFVHLPEYIISAEPVQSLEDIPVGYGA